MINIKKIQRYPIKVSEKEHPPITGGCGVIVVNPQVWPLGNIKPYTIGVLNGLRQPYKDGHGLSVMFGFRAYMDSSHCSASGGPGSIWTPVECFQFTGYEIELPFWKWKDGWAGAGRGEGYTEWVPLFEWKHNEKDLLHKPVHVSEEEYYEMKEGDIVSIKNDFYRDWVRGNDGLAVYMEDVMEVFAVDNHRTFTSQTIVLDVYFKSKYWHWKDDKRAKYKPKEYFKQKCQIRTPEFKDIRDKDYRFMSGVEYFARNYYTC